VLALLAVWGMARIVNVWLSWVLALRDKQRQAALVTAAFFPLFLVMVGFGASIAGAKGVAVAVTLHMLLNVCALAVLTARNSPFTFRRVFDRVRAAGRATVAAVPAGALAVVVTRGRPAIVTLVVGGVATAAIYGAALLMPASSRRRLALAFRGR
jgi:O-antigen/teichoic acid export membrane protein